MAVEQVSRISVEEVKRRRAQGERILVVDVRSRMDYERAHIPGALWLPAKELPSRFHELPRGQTIVFY